ncbi:ABC-three component system protein [Bacillus suaedae]|uniref:ABC-three component systems C-terminal domain-containing protein n=1 Tax=Halalkalibacter suaedae TaxID=2822140 RepID=A0A940WPJ6_9BACI|nr:ABC-three component system protein [Bacillus suaedae]MBP3950299.1 hypothetical protein [Bacillus suaedae]
MSIKNNGHHNLNNTGSDNDFSSTTNNYYSQGLKTLNRSYLYEFCEAFSQVDPAIENDYNTQLTSDITKKMTHNEIDVYRTIFQECDHYYSDVDSILLEIPKRQRIITNINRTYIKKKNFEKWENKDHLCDLVYQSLYQILVNNLGSDIMEEDATEAIHAIMYYAFIKCKLLDPI